MQAPQIVDAAVAGCDGRRREKTRIYLLSRPGRRNREGAQAIGRLNAGPTLLE